jgi:PQQ-dependent catabolism-associated CXXCW motif protein
MMKSLLIFCLLAYSCTVLAVTLPEGYRTERYRALTPQHVPGGETLDTDELQNLLAEQDPILIDVMAVLFRPETLDFGGEWLLNEPRYHIPNSVWLPNIGYGELTPLIRHYMESQLQQLTAGNKATPLVFYCILDCWMAWNASKRAALELKYTQVYWYREGMDGWEAAELPTVEAIPVPISTEAAEQE